MLVPYQWGWGGEWLCCWWLGWAVLWKAVICEDLYGAKAESVLSETQNSWVNNKQTCSNYTDKFVLVSTNENQCRECLCCVLTIYNTVLKNIRKKRN